MPESTEIWAARLYIDAKYFWELERAIRNFPGENISAQRSTSKKYGNPVGNLGGGACIHARGNQNFDLVWKSPDFAGLFQLPLRLKDIFKSFDLPL